MAKLTVTSGDSTHEMIIPDGASVREFLDAAGIRVRSGCRGNGACGLCLVQIEGGKVSEPTKNERVILSPEQLDGNIRLACQLVPENDLRIRVINTTMKSNWQDLPPDRSSRLPSYPHRASDRQPTETAYGLAVDLGTTHISLSLLGLKQGNRLAGRIGLNPQYCHGADVVTRLIAAGESPDTARKIARMPLDAISEALLDMCSRIGISRREVVRIAVVGNTPMLTLLTESDPNILLQPRFWTQPIDCKLETTQTWVRILGIHPEAAVEIVSPFAGFVGSDLLAGVLATRLTEQACGLLIDFGTNSEMALWDGGTLRVTSAAGGPAFEGCGIRCGMPAEPGAIYRIDWRIDWRVDRQQGSTGFDVQVIDGGKAKGLCGSGLVDLIAFLRSTGALSSTGKFTIPNNGGGFFVQQESPAITLSHGDVDMFQRAKAAIGIGIKTLLAGARRSADELTRVYVSGAFGLHLNIRNAQLIGLLPDVPPGRAELYGNTALAGCECLLLSPERMAELASLRKRSVIINLSETPDFETLFLENLYLQPLKKAEGT